MTRLHLSLGSLLDLSRIVRRDLLEMYVGLWVVDEQMTGMDQGQSNPRCGTAVGGIAGLGEQSAEPDLKHEPLPLNMNSVTYVYPHRAPPGRQASKSWTSQSI
jgi:hypothetical protein